MLASIRLPTIIIHKGPYFQLDVYELHTQTTLGDQPQMHSDEQTPSEFLFSRIHQTPPEESPFSQDSPHLTHPFLDFLNKKNSLLAKQRSNTWVHGPLIQ